MNTRTKTFLLMSLLFALIQTQAASPPAWWEETSALDPQRTANDHAAATTGQAMHMLAKFAEKIESLPGDVTTGSQIEALLQSYAAALGQDPKNNNKALAIGQLKYIGKLCYDRLRELSLPTGLTSPQLYPWSVDTSDDQDDAIATLGQVKKVFDFDILVPEEWDLDTDGLPDVWEIQHFNSLNYNQQTTFGHSEMTLGQMHANGLNPTVYGHPKTQEDSDGDGVLDELEAIANDVNFTYPKSPESSYIAIWLDQLTGPNAMPRNADNSHPELIAMNDNGQLFFAYTPPPSPGSEPRQTLLVYDQGVYTAMPPFTFQGSPAVIRALDEAKSSSFGGGGLLSL